MNQSKYAHSRIDILGQNGNDAEVYHHLHKHGHRPKSGASLTYVSWMSMRNRCNRPTAHNYPLYGGRGITVCTRWDDFIFFLTDMGERPEGTTLDRIDPNGNYEPSNCRWTDSKTQSRNKRDSIVTEIDGVLLNLVDVAYEFEIPKTTIYRRFHAGLRGYELIDKANRNKFRLGEKTGTSKLKEAQVIEIRNLFKQGYTQSKLSKLFLVSQTTIHELVNYKTWKHI